MGFEGLSTFTGDEVGNLVIGQMGFAVLGATNSSADGTNDAGTKGAVTVSEAAGRTFVAIKFMKNGSTNKLGCEAITLLGDNLDLDDVADGDIIYGPFSYVQGITDTGSVGKLICYFGNSQ